MMQNAIDNNTKTQMVLYAGLSSVNLAQVTYSTCTLTGKDGNTEAGGEEISSSKRDLP